MKTKPKVLWQQISILKLMRDHLNIIKEGWGRSCFNENTLCMGGYYCLAKRKSNDCSEIGVYASVSETFLA